jgi:hypothetical protein
MFWQRSFFFRAPSSRWERGRFSAVGIGGWRIVGLTRLSPVFPFNTLNYAFGLTGVSLKEVPPCHRTTHFREVCAQVSGKPNAKVHECYSCHQSTAWNDIKAVGWYKSH